jgi:hypothetical protein
MRNANWRLLVGGFLPDGTSVRLLFRGLARWALAEWRNLFLTTKPAAEAASLAPQPQES